LFDLDVGRDAPHDEQVAQGVDHVTSVQLALHLDRQAFPAGFIQILNGATQPLGLFLQPF